MSRTDPATALVIRTLASAYARLGMHGRGVLLAVSGGADSTALMHGTALVRESLGLRVEVATLDHGLRPGSADEAREVARQAAVLGLPCHVRELELSALPGVEARAREARYAVLEALRTERGLDAVATAHTASDQAETLLMRLSRGTALRGSAGVHETRPGLLRPLLERTRQDVVAFLAEQGVGWAKDPMNADPAFFRARVRHDALPALSRAAGFAVEARLASFARLAAEDDALLSSWADGAWHRLLGDDGALDAVGVRALEPPLRRRVLARLLSDSGAGVDDATLSRVLEAVSAGGSATLGGGLQLRAAGGRVRCVRLHPPRAVVPLRLSGEGARGVLEGTGWSFSVEPRAPAPGTPGMALAVGASWPLTARTRQAGDRVDTEVGRRKLQDVLVDARVPAEARDVQPVVVDATGTILWVPGVWSPATPAVASGQYLWAVPPGPSKRVTPSL